MTAYELFFHACSGPRDSNTLVPVQDVPNPNPNPYTEPVQNVPNPNPLILTPNPSHNPNPNPNINPNPNPDPNSWTGICVEKNWLPGPIITFVPRPPFFPVHGPAGAPLLSRTVLEQITAILVNYEYRTFGHLLTFFEAKIGRFVPVQLDETITSAGTASAWILPESW